MLPLSPRSLSVAEITYTWDPGAWFSRTETWRVYVANTGEQSLLSSTRKTMAAWLNEAAVDDEEEKREDVVPLLMVERKVAAVEEDDESKCTLDLGLAFTLKRYSFVVSWSSVRSRLNTPVSRFILNLSNERRQIILRYKVRLVPSVVLDQSTLTCRCNKMNLRYHRGEFVKVIMGGSV